MDANTNIFSLRPLTLATALLWFAQSSAPGPACAEPAAFGSAGQRILAGNIGLELKLGSGPVGSDSTARDLGVNVMPSLLYFVATDFALGLAPSAAYADRELGSTPYTEVELAIAPGCALNIPLSPAVSLFPQLWLGVGYAHASYELRMVPSAYQDPDFFVPEPGPLEISGWFAYATLPLPLIFRVGAATYVSVGPRARVRVPFDAGLRIGSLGLTAGFGGVF